MLSANKIRDAILYKEIKNWETGYVGEKSIQERQKYIKTLRDQNTKHHQSFTGLAANKMNSPLRWEISSKLEQTQWRVDYLSDLFI